MIHLAELGVLRRDVAMTHCVQVDDHELAVMAETGVSVAHCPTTALKVSYGVTQVGKMPEMVQMGINVSIGTDGNNASNYSDLMRATYLVAGLFKDARQDPQMFPAEMAYEMATLGGAKTMQMEDTIGSLEVGKRADVVLHDTDRPEWRPLAQRGQPARVVGRRSRRAHRVRRRREGRRGRPHDHHRRGHRSTTAASSRARRSPPGRACPTRRSGRCAEPISAMRSRDRMAHMQQLPAGTWPSPVTAESLVGGAR